MNIQGVEQVQQLCFDFLSDVPVVVRPHEGQITSDAGLLALRQFDQRWRYTQRMAACLQDSRRDPDHSVLSMLRQRLYGILSDYEDCNDHDALRHDPLFKLLADRLPQDDPLASQPTLCRFENGVSIPALKHLAKFLIDTGIERLRRKNDGSLPDRLVLDIDPTDDPAHGQQQLVMFHGYYDQHQYFPLLITEPTTQHIFSAHLRPGAVHASCGADKNLAEVVDGLRAIRPGMALHVRGDCGLGLPKMYEFCEARNVTYTFGLAANSRLQAMAQGLLDQAVRQYEQTQQKQRLFAVFSYRAETWDRERTVIAKAEAHEKGTNLRFVVTIRPVADAAAAGAEYDHYVQRGTHEQRNDEIKNGLHADRLSCHRFVANFWRLLLHVAAYNLLNAVRDHEQVPSELRTAQPATWRTRLIKVAAWVRQSSRRVLVELAGQWPFWPNYVAVSQRCATSPSGP